MTSSTVATPSSSLTLTEMRLASGAIPTYRLRSGSVEARRVPSPARMPATCVPWPYVSPALVASGLVTTDATTRERPSAPLKSARWPAMPVSMTATPTPLPVSDPVVLFHACWARTAAGNAGSTFPSS
jgi:hypothetical protein